MAEPLSKRLDTLEHQMLCGASSDGHDFCFEEVPSDWAIHRKCRCCGLIKLIHSRDLTGKEWRALKTMGYVRWARVPGIGPYGFRWVRKLKPMAVSPTK